MINIAFLPASATLTVEQALDGAKNQRCKLTRVLIIGEYDDGELFVRSSRITRAEALWLIKRAELYTLNPES